MGKSGWAAAAGLGALALLLAACGGSASSSSAGAMSTRSASAATSSTGSSTAGTAATSAASTNGTSGAKSGSSSGSSGHSSSAHPTPYPSASANAGVTFPPQGTTVMIVQKSSLGYVLAEATGQVVYTYANDKKGGTPTCTGSCAAVWLAATGVPKAGPADTFPGTFGTVRSASGAEQITYNGYPLYTYKGAQALSVAGNGTGGVWHVVMLSASDISGG